MPRVPKDDAGADWGTDGNALRSAVESGDRRMTLASAPESDDDTVGPEFPLPSGDDVALGGRGVALRLMR